MSTPDGQENFDNAGRSDGAELNSDSTDDVQDAEYLAAVERGDVESARQMVAAAARAAGYTEELYHQTDGDFTVFDVRHKGAGTRDNVTPFGIFMKKSARDIGLKGQKQMLLYAKLQNPLRVQNREQLARELGILSPEYKAVMQRAREIDAEYSQKSKDAKNALRDYVSKVREAKPDGARIDLYADPEFNRLHDLEDQIVDEWVERASENDLRAKEIITATLKANGYDGVILERDVGSGGRMTDAYIALTPQQVKSGAYVTHDDQGNVIPLSKRFSEDSDDIRWSDPEDDANAVRYDFTKSFAEQVEDYKKGLIPQYDTLLISGTPAVWQAVGFNALPVTINRTHVDYALNGTKDVDHHIGEALLKDLPNAIQKPIAIIQSQSPNHNDRAVIILSMVHNGKNVIGAIEVDGQGRTNSISIDSNAMTSLFAKTNALKQLHDAIDNTVNGKVELFYWNKKEAIALLQKSGHQLSGALPQDGSIHSIHENGSNVKSRLQNVTESQQFKRWFGDWQNNPGKASKVVDKNGKPLVVYHGTNAEFDVFQKRNKRTRGQLNFGEGYYFTSSRSMAENYADGENGRIMETYVAIRDPYTVYWSTFDKNDFDAIAKKLGDGTEVSSENVAQCLQRLGYDGIIERTNNGADNPIRTVVAFESNQIKSATDNIGTFDEGTGNIYYSDPEDDVKSDREILAEALMDVAKNDVERNALKVYQERAKKLDQMDKRLHEVNAEIRSMMFSRGARDEAYNQKLAALKLEKERLERAISQGDRKLFSLEATRSMQDILDREKQRTAKLWADAGRSVLKNYRERNLCRIYYDRIEDKAKKLHKMLTENSEKHRMPDAFKQPVAAFLSLLDFSSYQRITGGEATKKDVELQQKFDEVRALLESITNENSEEYLAGLDLPPDAVEEFAELAKAVAQLAVEGRESGEMVLRRMSSEQLKTLNTTLYTMMRAIRQANDLFATERFRHVDELSLHAINEWEKYPTGEARGKVSDFLTWENLTPYYAFGRLGEAGRALFDGFRAGHSRFAFLVKEMIDYTDKLYTEEEVKAWSRKVHTFQTEKGEFYMTTAQIMTLYEQWKDQDAKKHLLGGGVRVADISFGMKKKYANDPNGTTLNELLVDQILSTLTVRERAVADALQKFMAEECAKWGNEVSYKRWGIKLFGLDYYFPIESDKNTTSADVEQAAKETGLFTLLHKSFTKKRVFKANNRIMVRNIFDVFSSHATDMAKYNAFALPMLDVQKFINFKEFVHPAGEETEATVPMLPGGEGETKNTSFTTKEVRTSMEKAFGKAAYGYMKQFLIDLNGDVGGRSSAEGLLQKGITAHKIAAVGANIRVAMLQPTSYVRVLNVMEPKYFFGGLGAAGHLKECMRRMQQYSGIALWKSLGYRDANIAAPVQSKIKHDEGKMQKITEKSMMLAELGDKVTWGAIWHACELEIRDKKAGLKIGSEEYYQAVAQRFEDVIYSTQVVDSVLTKSQLMRSKSFFATLFTSFMSEPTLSYNLLASNAITMLDKHRRGEKVTKQDAKPFVRAVGVFAIAALVQAAVESLIDAARYDDDDEEYGERYWAEFFANSVQEIVPLNLIPIVKDVWGIALSTINGDYMNSSRIDLEVYNRLSRAAKAIGKIFEGEEVTYSTVHKILSAVSSVTGLPISNAIRDVVALWNTIMGDILGMDVKWK